MVGAGGVDLCQGLGLARSTVRVVIVVLPASLALLLGCALGGQPSQLASCSRFIRAEISTLLAELRSAKKTN